jgi:hypothetical protein
MLNRYFSKATKYRGSVIELAINLPKVEESEGECSVFDSTRESSIGVPFGTVLQLQSRTSSRSSWTSLQDVCGSVSPDTKDSESASAWDISPAIREGRFYSYPEDYQQPNDFTVPAGGVALEPLFSLPIEASKRNAKLFHFCWWPAPHILDRTDTLQSFRDYLHTCVP